MPDHFIKTIQLELTANSEKEGFELQQGFSELIKSRLGEKMEAIFDQFGKEQNIRLDKLVLEIENLNADNWEDEFLERFSKQLSKKLNALKLDSSTSNSTFISEKISKWDSFLLFLQNGTLSWHANQLNINDLNKFLKKELKLEASFQKLEILLKTNQLALERLIHHSSYSTLDLVWKNLTKAQNSFLPFYKILLKTFSKWFSENEIKLEICKIAFQLIMKNEKENLNSKVWKDNFQIRIIGFVINHFSKRELKTQSKIKSNFNFQNLILEELKVNFLESKIKLSEPVFNFLNQESKQQKNFYKENQTANSIEKVINHDSIDEILEEGIFIKNAGLVLLNPYLQILFKEFELLDGRKFTNENTQNQAVLILQYLATGEFSSFENEVVLNKVLCNIPTQKPIPIELHLEQNQIDECENLLNAVIKNWSALGNTSVDGLRESFLLRDGKLSKNENGDWLLQVESKSFDILLSTLPWAISIIKLPWMEKKLLVEWT